jgi:hypothetical protein
MKPSKQDLENEIAEAKNKHYQDLAYINRFVNGIMYNNFHQGFLRALFSDSRIDMRKATNDIMRFISMNKHKWEIHNDTH